MTRHSLTSDLRVPAGGAARAVRAVWIRSRVLLAVVALVRLGARDSFAQTEATLPVAAEHAGFAPLGPAAADEPPATAIPTPSAAERKAANNATLNAANNPLTPKLTLNLHNYYIPSIYGVPDRHADQFLLQGVIPHDLLGPPQLLRITLPIQKVPTPLGGYDGGLGDLSLIDLFMFHSGGADFGVGPMVVPPTATSSTQGSKAWQAGAAAIAVAPQDWGLLVGLTTFQQSFANASSSNDVSLLTFQPIIVYNIPEGFYLRSTAIWNFNFSDNAWYIPAGFGVGHVWTIEKLTINVFGEPQYTIFHHGMAPQWQIFAGSNLQLAF